MENIYPEGPVGVPEEFAKPGAAYKRKAWIALMGLGLFIAFYLFLAGWFSLTAYRLITGAVQASRDGFWLFIAGLGAAFFAIFMIKALFPGKRNAKSDDLEVTAVQQPRLFEFLYRLADEAGAPRPHRVFLSARVNAAVFYELSVLNLFYPSKKNLEIGLGLVNVLSLGEFKAVCAHEFGHFAQRSMAVGRWVYTAQQIAGKIVNKRDALDSLLDGLSRIDIRIAWLGWIMKIIVWSIRSVVDLLFKGVVLAQRALSREMEMQADLVAVSLTGSDTLVHALHRLAAADDAWARTMQFAAEEAREKRIVGDVFAVQSRIIEHLSRILGDPLYGKYPPLPAQGAEQHRIFKSDFALPPTMWATHPLNFERENNAKRHYLPSVADDRSAWTLFEDAAALRRDVSAKLAGDAEPAPLDESLSRLEQVYDREYFNRAYRGIYLGRAITLQSAQAEELYSDTLAADAGDLDRLYPESLAADLETLRNLEKEVALLESLQDKTFTPADGVIRHRGRQLRRDELPQALDATRNELTKAKAAFDEHDRQCRSVHLALARKLGQGWEDYLTQLISLLHYLEHTVATLEENLAVLRKVFALETAGRTKLGSDAVYRILHAAEKMYRSIATVYERAGAISFDPSFVQHFGAESFAARLGKLELVPPTRENLGNWLNVSESWAGHTLQALRSLSGCTLERLLQSEAMVAAWARSGEAADAAPAPPQLPAARETFTPGGERLRNVQPGFWHRFQSSQGWGVTMLRFAVAGGIIGAVVLTGMSLSRLDIAVYNGLGRMVRVSVDGASVSVPAYSSAMLSVRPKGRYAVQTEDEKGRAMEVFEADGGNGGRLFYNVMAASPLVQWSATYGNVKPLPQENLGEPRWGNARADVLFTDPPASISAKYGGVRTVLSGVGGMSPNEIMGLVTDEAADGLFRTHARWDDAHDPNLLAWISALHDDEQRKDILSRRLEDNPDELVSARYLQDLATPQERARMCEQTGRQSAAAPDNPNLRYLAIRCMKTRSKKIQAFDAGLRRWPGHPWFAFAAGYTAEEQGDWPAAVRLMKQAAQNEGALRDKVYMDLARLKRLQAGDPATDLTDLARESGTLRTMLSLESGKNIADGPLRAYRHLAVGELDQAVALVRGSVHEQRVLRLAAASWGASRALVERALALPVDAGNMDDAALSSAAALAIRYGRDLEPYRAAWNTQLGKLVSDWDGVDEPLYKFAIALRQRKIDEAEKALRGLPMELRASAYAMGAASLGSQAPAAWRTQARCLLFAYERPYLI
jgi:Zn-dependent protease with chaperone function